MWPLSSHFPSHKANVPFVSLLRTPYIESRADPPPPHLLPKSIKGQDDICKHFCSKQESRNQHRDGCFGKPLPNLPHCLSALAPNRHSVRWQEAVKAQQQCPLLSPAWQQQMADLVPSLGTGVKGSSTWEGDAFHGTGGEATMHTAGGSHGQGGEQPLKGSKQLGLQGLHPAPLH